MGVTRPADTAQGRDTCPTQRECQSRKLLNRRGCPNPLMSLGATRNPFLKRHHSHPSSSGKPDCLLVVELSQPRKTFFLSRYTSQSFLASVPFIRSALSLASSLHRSSCSFLSFLEAVPDLLIPATITTGGRVSEVRELVATVSASLTEGFCRSEKPTVNHRTIDRRFPLSRSA